MPLGLAQQGPCLYLVCRFDGYESERSLAVHRIESASTTQRKFERPADFDLQRYDNEGRFGFGDGRRIRLQFSISRQAGLHLLETPLSVGQIVKVHEDYFRITAEVIETDQLTWWLRGFGEDVWSVRRLRLDD